MVKVNETARVLRLKSETRQLLFTAPPASKAKKNALCQSQLHNSNRGRLSFFLTIRHFAACVFLLYITLFSSEYYRIPPLLILLFDSYSICLLLTFSAVQELPEVVH